VPRRWPSAAEAVELIRAAGGVAVVAHPFWDVKDPARVRALVESLPLGGVEAFYPAHTRDQTAFCLELCAERGLVPSASSDFHGPTHKTFSRFGAYQTFGLGEPVVPPNP
jgi:predicted metal-dependent phosphoesterase TrpH